MLRFAYAAMIASIASAGSGIDYTQNGANWPETDDLCGTGEEQSPIDLST